MQQQHAAAYSKELDMQHVVTFELFKLWLERNVGTHIIEHTFDV